MTHNKGHAWNAEILHRALSKHASLCVAIFATIAVAAFEIKLQYLL